MWGLEKAFRLKLSDKVTEQVKKETPSEVATVAVECTSDADVDGFMDLMASTARFENNEETISEDGQTAKGKVKMVYGDGEDETETIDLFKQDDEWKYLYFYQIDR